MRTPNRSGRSLWEPTFGGAWYATITFTTNPPPTAPDGTEIGVQGFNSDGLLTEFATAALTTGYGVWMPTDDHGGFRYTFRELVMNSGELIGYVIVNQTGSVSADGLRYTSSGGGQIYSPTGVPLAPSSESTTQATRITF